MECKDIIDIIRRKQQSLSHGELSQTHESNVEGQIQATQSQQPEIIIQEQGLSQQDVVGQGQGSVINNATNNLTPNANTSSFTRTRLPKLTLPKFRET